MSRTKLLISIAVTGALAFPGTAAAASSTPADGVIVKYHRGVSLEQQSRIEQRAGAGATIDAVERLGVRVVADGGEPGTLAARLSRYREVLYAEPNFIVSTLATPNDARYAEQWGLDNVGQFGGQVDADIDAPQGWDVNGLGAFPRDGGVAVGIVDTGVERQHEDLVGAISICASSKSTRKGVASVANGKCDDDDGHGTHVAGILAARANNSIGIAGIAFNSPLIVCKALSKAGGTVADVAQCVTFAYEQGARVINLSLSAPDSVTLHDALRYAYRDGGVDGAVLVAAAGNDGTNMLRFPAAYAEVISVAATNARDERAPFSNANGDVELAAPGMGVLSTIPGGYGVDNGTSMSVAAVAAVAAQVRGSESTASAATVREVLIRCADDLGAAGRDDVFGFGRVNLARALAAMGEPANC